MKATRAWWKVGLCTVEHPPASLVLSTLCQTCWPVTSVDPVLWAPLNAQLCCPCHTSVALLASLLGRINSVPSSMSPYKSLLSLRCPCRSRWFFELQLACSSVWGLLWMWAEWRIAWESLWVEQAGKGLLPASLTGIQKPRKSHLAEWAPKS